MQRFCHYSLHFSARYILIRNIYARSGKCVRKLRITSTTWAHQQKSSHSRISRIAVLSYAPESFIKYRNRLLSEYITRKIYNCNMQSMYYVCCCKQVSDITTTYFFGAVIFDTRVMSSWEYTTSFVCDILILYF